MDKLSHAGVTPSPRTSQLSLTVIAARQLLDKIGRERIAQVIASGDALEASAMIREAII